MDAREIFARLNNDEGFPLAAIAAARDNRDAMVELFLKRIEEPADPIREPAAARALFFAFHLLGEWRVKAAYRPLARWLAAPVTCDVLGDATTETSHRVMAAVFDGDPEPLYTIIRDEEAYEYIRSRMLQAIAMLTKSGDLPREDTGRFLEECFSTLEPRKECAMWPGLVDAISMLGLAQLEPLVREAFARGSIDDSWMSFVDFQKDLQHAIANPDAEPRFPDGNLTLFGDTIEELSKWAGFAEKPSDRDVGSSISRDSSRRVTVRNPFRDVGRNDPCPCGSGGKFKKCCLNLSESSLPSTLAD